MKPTKASKGNFIGGRFLAVTDPSGMVPSRNPGNLNENPFGFPYSFEHVHDAVGEAKQAFRAWRGKKFSERATLLKKYGAELEKNKARLVAAIGNEVGKPVWEAEQEIQDTLELIEFFTSMPEPTVPAGPGPHSTTVKYFPRGVAVMLTPAVEPIFVTHSHIVPSLLFGNTLVVKASRNCPWVGQVMAEIFEDTGFPAGVVNVVQGDEEAARRLVANPSVDLVFFAGHFETAQKIRTQVVADYWKVLVLEAGGKNSHVVWEDAPYEKALYETLTAALLTAGQRYTSVNRVLVHDKIFDRFVDDFHTLAKKAKIDAPDKNPMMGPLLNEAMMEGFLRFQGIAQREGCQEVMRGKALERETPGYYVSPSIHVVTQADPKSVYQKSEIFGPDIAFYRVKGIEDTVEILNLNTHALVGSVYTRSREVWAPLFEEGAAGTLFWNLPATTRRYRLPVGGLKKSGNSRPMGLHALYQCTYATGSLESQADMDESVLPAQTPRL